MTGRADAVAAGAPLRIGLVTSGFQPAWRRRVVAALAAANGCELALVILMPAPTPSLGIADRLLGVIDRSLARQADDSLAPVAIADLIAGIPTVMSPDDDRAIQEHDLDVILCLGAEIPADRADRLARHGAWALRFGGPGRGLDAPDAARDVLAGRPSTVAALVRLGEGPGRVLATAALKTNRLSARRHADHVGAVAAGLVGRALRGLVRDGRVVGVGDPADVVAAETGIGPGPIEMAGLLARFAGRLAVEGARRAWHDDRWALAYTTRGVWDGHQPDLRDLHLIPAPPGHFWADPFPAEIDGKTWIYFEDYPDALGRGIISVVEVGPEGAIGPSRVALERPYHLSYPFIFRWDSRDYMIPETTHAGAVELFRRDGGPDRWAFDRVLIADIRAADVTLAEHDGLWWLFAAIPAPGAHNDLEDLHLFHAENPLGPWTPHPRNPVKSDIASARPAGRLYRREGTWYRPSQDCTQGYGHAMTLNRVVAWDLDAYREEPAGRIDPDWHPRIDRTHTFNALGDLFVADARIAERRFGRKRLGR